MSSPESHPDEDDDLRQLLEASTVSTSSTHDAAVLQAARTFTQPGAVESPRGALAAPMVQRTRRYPARRWAAAAGILALLAAGAVWREWGLQQQMAGLIEQRTALSQTVLQLRARISSLESETARGTKAAVTARPAAAVPPPQVSMLLSAVLSPGLTRGTGDLPQISIPKGVSVVRLRLDVSTTVDQRSTVLRLTRSGKQVWQGGLLEVYVRDSHGTLMTDIPVAALASGEYELTVNAPKSNSDFQVDYYYFEVHRE
jgi:hypothetical protein